MQVAGGGIAAGATTGSGAAKAGDNLLIAGLASQVVTMACCAVLVVDYYFSLRRSKGHRRSEVSDMTRTEEGMVKEDAAITKDATNENCPSHGRPDGGSLRMKALVCTCLVAFVTVFIRCVYRYVPPHIRIHVLIQLLTAELSTIELAGGWNDALMRNEILFSVLDGM